MAPRKTLHRDRLAGEPDANDADVVEILAVQRGLTMPLTGLGRLAERAGDVPPVLSATRVRITRGNRAAMARLARSGADAPLWKTRFVRAKKEICVPGRSKVQPGEPSRELFPGGQTSEGLKNCEASGKCSEVPPAQGHLRRRFD